MEVLLQQIINGLVLGSMYALIALGYTMVYGIIQLINFAHGEVLMVGALTAWSIIGLMQASMPGAPGWIILILATIIACVVAAALNFVIEKVAYRALRKKSPGHSDVWYSQQIAKTPAGMDRNADTIREHMKS